MTTVPLRGLVDVRRDVIDPTHMPPQVKHFSIPALDAGDPETVDSEAIDSHKLRVLGGEVLISRLNPRKPRVHLVREDLSGFGVASTEFVALVPTRTDRRFLRYFLLAESVRQHLDSQVRSATRSHQRVESSAILALRMPAIQIDEQQRIADFLDDHVSRIDRIIAARREQSTLLSHLARSRLLTAVSKIACQYPSTRLGRISQVRSGAFLPSERFSEDGPYEVVGGNGIAGRFEAANVRAGTIAVGRVGALCGNVHLLESDSWLTDNALGVELNNHAVGPRFVAALLDSLNLNSLASQTAQPLLTGTQVADQLIPVGMTAEQEAKVVEAWENARSRAHTSPLQHLIDLLTEYKTSLITAAVTGGLDVTTANSSIPG